MGKLQRSIPGSLRIAIRRLSLILGLASLLLPAFSGTLCFGQATATILGNVYDPSGAAVPNATITATDVLTGFSRKETTGKSGEYAIPLLPVGTYQVTAVMTGFKTETQTGVVLQVEANQRVDLTLQLGTASEKVTVSGEAPVIQTDSASVGEVVTDQTMEQLPLNGRDFMYLTLLAPGLTDPPNDLRHSYQGVAPSANGARSEYNAYLMDGTSNTEHFNGDVSVVPPLDAIDQFKLQTSDYSAEYGQGGGLVVNLVTKSGTNALHGSAWDFLRNDVFDGVNFFATTKPRPPLKRNQFGGTIGGPIKKDKAFFFFAYEGLRQEAGETIATRVPTALERAGNFSQSVGTLPHMPGTTTPYANNTLPALDPISQAIINNYEPLPNNPSNPLTNYIASPSAPSTQNNYVGRVDELLTSKDSLFARFNVGREHTTTRNGYINCCDYVDSLPSEQGAIGYTHTFSGAAVNEFRFGANRLKRFNVDSEQGTNISGQLGITNIWSDTSSYHFPILAVTGFGVPDGMAYGLFALNTFDFADNFSLIKGGHTLKMGAEYIDYRFDDLNPGSAPLSVTFSGQITGNALADFENGTLSSYTENYLQPFIQTRMKSLEAYIQDDWRVTSKLTLNLGARYTFEEPIHTGQDTGAWVDFKTGAEIIPSNLNIGTYAFIGGIERQSASTLMHNDNKVAPRVGFAYRPFGNNKTVIRSGFGMFTVLEQGNAGRQAATNPPFRVKYSNSNNTTGFGWNTGRPPIATALAGLASGVNAQFVDTHFRNGYMLDWNFTLEREIAPQTVVSLAYTGSKGTELAEEYNINVPAPGAGAIYGTGGRAPYPDFSTIAYITNGGNSTYHALDARIEKHARSGLTFLSSFVYSKTLGAASTINQEDFVTPNCLRCEKGPLYFDVRDRFATSLSYELPFGAGKHFLSQPGVARVIFGGWIAAGIITDQTGFPMTVTTNDNANVGNTQRPFLIGNANPSNRTVSAWIPKSAFAQNTSGPTGNCQLYTGQSYCFGNAGRGIVTSPALNDFDFSLIRNFKISERWSGEFHWDTFDALNHPNFGFPNLSYSAGTFGVITSVISSSPSREMQFGLKLRF